MHNILFSISRARGVFRFIMVSGKISKIFVTFRLFILLRLLSKCAYGVVMAKIHFRIVVYWLSFPFGSCDFLCFKEICSRTIPIFYSKDWKWLQKSYIKNRERSELLLLSKLQQKTLKNHRKSMKIRRKINENSTKNHWKINKKSIENQQKSLKIQRKIIEKINS